MPNIEGLPHPELAKAPCPFWGLVRGNTEQNGRGTPSWQKHELRPCPEPNAHFTQQRAALQDLIYPTAFQSTT
ncbi:hypothetical protein NDU88_005173 [Pleurodeles waltl]|uniref:Uncharacterized protein n=1 Tax=Pleurodeles waltl TaxID=8319 RepID=A0AAV7TTK7_PLEWA|nr:hypothetical protein NDU88_005173 [Pleurodeles waltl]